MDTKDVLYRIDRTARTVLYVVTCVLFLLLVLACFGVSYRWLWGVFGGLFAACVLCRMCLSPFVKSEEEEEFEQKVAYILEQKAAKSKPLEPINETYSPLRELSDEQEKQVIQLLHDLPAHPNKPESINLALVARYLTALDQLGKINLTNKGALRAWVARITEKEVPNSSQFNEALPNTNRSEVAKIRRELERSLQLK